MTRTRLFTSACLVACTAGCLTGEHQIASVFAANESVGPSGGTVSVSAAADAALAGTSIAIPAGALAENVTITIAASSQSVAQPGTVAAGPVVEFGPDGTTFAVPATMTLPFALPSGADQSSLEVAAVESSGAAKIITIQSFANGLAKFPVSGFTRFGVVSRLSTDAGSTLVSLAITPAHQNVPVGTTLQMVAVGTFSNGTTSVLTQVTWMSSPASVLSIDSSGVATAVSPGIATITASVIGAGALSATTSVMVTPATLVAIAVTPSNATISVGETLQMTAAGTYSDGSTIDLSSQANWTCSPTSVATLNSTGIVAGLSQGAATITASVGGVSGTTTLNVGPPTLVSISLSPENVQLAVGATQQLTVTGAYSDGSMQDETNAAVWVSDNSAVVVVSASGVITGVGAGTAEITVSVISVTAAISVTVTSPGALAISPANPTVTTGSTIAFSASGGSGTGYTWTLTANGSGGAITSAGIYTAGSTAGVTDTVQIADSSGATATTQVTVSTSAPTLVSLTITPPTPTIAYSQPVQLTATGSYSDGTMVDLTASAVWTSSDATSATVFAGLVTSQNVSSPQIVTIAAFVSGVSAADVVTVEPIQLSSITITPATSNVDLGQTVQLDAVGHYTDGSTADISTSVIWSSSHTSIATVSTSGSVESVFQGTVVITATDPTTGISATATVHVGSLALMSISISPPNATVAVGSTVTLRAIGTFSDGTMETLTAPALTWSVDDSSIATVTSSGIVTGVESGQGPAIIAATYGAVTQTVVITVTAPALLSITLSPANEQIAVGKTIQMSAVGNYSDGSAQDITSAANWNVSNSIIAAFSAPGLLVGLATGTVTVTATLGTVTAATSVTVISQDSLTVTPGESTVAPMASITFTVSGGTGPYVWTVSTNGSGGTISSTGMYTAGSTGNTLDYVQVNDTAGAVGVAVVTVTAGIAIAPSTATVGIGDTVDFTAIGGSGVGYLWSLAADPSGGTISANGIYVAGMTGSVTDKVKVTDSLGNTATAKVSVVSGLTITPATATVIEGGSVQFSSAGGQTPYTWSLSTNRSGGTINTSGNYSAGQNAGTDVVVVTDASGTTASASVLVESPDTLVSISISPQNNGIALGESVQLDAIGNYADGSSADVTDSVAWSSSAPTVAVVSSSGFVSSLAQGTTTITAESGSVVATAKVNVEAVQLVAMTITPSPVDITIGETQQLTLTGTYSDGTQVNLASEATWEVSNATIATVSQSGLLTALETGSATVVATMGGLSATAAVTVTPPALQTITIAPANPQLAVGALEQFDAIGSYSDGSTQDLTSVATWTSSDVTVATVSSESPGLVTGVSQGDATITATMDGITGTATVDVTP